MTFIVVFVVACFGTSTMATTSSPALSTADRGSAITLEEEIQHSSGDSDELEDSSSFMKAPQLNLILVVSIAIAIFFGLSMGAWMFRKLCCQKPKAVKETDVKPENKVETETEANDFIQV